MSEREYSGCYNPTPEFWQGSLKRVVRFKGVIRGVFKRVVKDIMMLFIKIYLLNSIKSNSNNGVTTLFVKFKKKIKKI